MQLISWRLINWCCMPKLKTLCSPATYILETNDTVQPHHQHPNNHWYTATKCHWLLGCWKQGHSVIDCGANVLASKGQRGEGKAKKASWDGWHGIWYTRITRNIQKPVQSLAGIPIIVATHLQFAEQEAGMVWILDGLPTRHCTNP